MVSSQFEVPFPSGYKQFAAFCQFDLKNSWIQKKWEIFCWKEKKPPKIGLLLVRRSTSLRPPVGRRNTIFLSRFFLLLWVGFFIRFHGSDSWGYAFAFFFRKPQMIFEINSPEVIKEPCPKTLLDCNRETQWYTRALRYLQPQLGQDDRWTRPVHSTRLATFYMEKPGGSMG